MWDKNDAAALRAFAGTATLMAALLVNALAQLPTGSIEGTVADVNGAAISDTNITIAQKAKGRQLSTTSIERPMFSARWRRAI